MIDATHIYCAACRAIQPVEFERFLPTEPSLGTAARCSRCGWLAFTMISEARVVHADVHRIPMGICQPQPGTEAKRPATRTSVPRVFLAGDWTHTALPSSMESAVRSGFLAAEALLADLGRARRFSHDVRARDGLAGVVRAATVAARALGPVLATARA